MKRSEPKAWEFELESYLKVLAEIVVFPLGMDDLSLDSALSVFLEVCPRDRLSFFKVNELAAWSSIKKPGLTLSGRRAKARGEPAPFLAPVRKRIAENRAFHLQLWDGRGIEDPEGTWSIALHCDKYRESGCHYYIRALMPLQTDPADLLHLARQFADRFEIHSGHGGLVFGHHPVFTYASFTRVYQKAKRFVGIDIDYLDFGLRHMRTHLNPPCWLNMIGKSFAGRGTLGEVPADVRTSAIYDDRAHAHIFTLGDAPTPLDVNRGAPGLGAYQHFGRWIAPVTVSGIGEFDGAGFQDNPGATDDWFLRFTDASSWAPALRN